MSDSPPKPEGQAAETPTPEDGVFVPRLADTLAQFLPNPNDVLPALLEARGMVDRELMEAIYVMLRVRP